MGHGRVKVGFGPIPEENIQGFYHTDKQQLDFYYFRLMFHLL